MILTPVVGLLLKLFFLATETGVLTDEPALARHVLEERKELSPFERLLVWVAGETGFPPRLRRAFGSGGRPTGFFTRRDRRR